jgi:hypothetical protein
MADLPEQLWQGSNPGAQNHASLRKKDRQVATMIKKNSASNIRQLGIGRNGQGEPARIFFAQTGRCQVPAGKSARVPGMFEVIPHA